MNSSRDIIFSRFDIHHRHTILVDHKFNYGRAKYDSIGIIMRTPL